MPQLSTWGSFVRRAATYAGSQQQPWRAQDAPGYDRLRFHRAGRSVNVRSRRAVREKEAGQP